MKKSIRGFLILSAFVIPALGSPATADAQRFAREVTITSPAPYETLSKGTYVPVKWKALNVDTVNIYYRNKETGRKQLIKENVSTASRSARWSIPTSLPDGEYDLIIEDPFGIARHTIQVKLRDGDLGRTFLNSDQLVTLTTPNGGETLHYDQPVSIEWDHSGLGNKELDILLGAPNGNGKIVWTYIATGIPGNWDRFTWYPDRMYNEDYLRSQGVTSINRYKILIVDPQNRNVKDTSDHYFTLQ